MVVEQDELQNECRSRETCSFGTPDALVCKAARSASAVLAAVGRSVGIGPRAGAGFDMGLPKGRGGASVTVAEQMSGEGSEQRSGPAEAIVARRSSRPEMPGWLLKEGADEEDESGSEYDPAEELPEPDEEAAEYEVDGVVRGRVRLHGSKQSTSGLQVDDE